MAVLLAAAAAAAAYRGEGEYKKEGKGEHRFLVLMFALRRFPAPVHLIGCVLAAAE